MSLLPNSSLFSHCCYHIDPQNVTFLGVMLVDWGGMAAAVVVVEVAVADQASESAAPLKAVEHQVEREAQIGTGIDETGVTGTHSRGGGIDSTLVQEGGLNRHSGIPTGTKKEVSIFIFQKNHKTIWVFVLYLFVYISFFNARFYSVFVCKVSTFSHHDYWIVMSQYCV